MSTSRPKDNESKQIGRKAERAFRANLPLNWIETDQDTGTDYGIDYVVQVKDSNDEVFCNFFLQLKGTESPTYIKNKKYITHSFKSSTLNLYRCEYKDLMVAVTDLSEDEEYKNCTTYYLWLDHELLDSISDRREKNDEVTIRVPTSNVITTKLDILDYLQAKLDGYEVLAQFQRTIERYSESPDDDIKRLAKAVCEKPVFLEAIKDDTGAPWLDNPENHTAGKLKSLSNSILSNKIGSASELVNEIEGNEELTEHERAELYSLKGMLLSLIGDDREAEENFGKAYEINTSSRYKINYFESQFRLGDMPGDEKLSYFVKNLDDELLKEAILKAKCLAILGQEEKALDALSRHPSDKTLTPKLLVYTLTGNISKFDEQTKQVKPEDLKGRQRFLFYVFVARRAYYRGINYNYESPVEERLPACGKKDYNLEQLKISFDNCVLAMKYAREEGFPYDTILLVEFACVVFSFFGRELKLIAFIEEVLTTRPNNKLYLWHLLVLKFNSHMYEDVLSIFDRIHDLNAEQVSYYIAAAYKTDNKPKVISLLKENESLILSEKPQNFAELYCMAAHCAYELIDKDSEQYFLSKVKSFENGKELLAINTYILKCNDFPERREQYRQELYEEYITLGKPIAIAQQLFNYLNYEEKPTAEIICELADVILRDRDFYPEENIIYAYALMTLERWELLEKLCLKVEALRGLNNKWALLKALSLEAQGRSAEALDLLDASISSDGRSVERAENFVHLCLNFGFFEKAENKLKELLSSAGRSKQISILQMLLFVYSSSGENKEQFLDTLVRYGNLIDRDDEIQEGNFLLMYLMSMNMEGVDHQDYFDSGEIKERFGNFTSKYPESKAIRIGNLSGDNPVAELRKISGVSEEQVQQWTANRNLIRNERLRVPYILLPAALDDVTDIFAVWTMGRFYGTDKIEYLMIHSMPSESDVVFDHIENDKVEKVFDETILLSLNALGILGRVLEAIPNIAIKKSTYEQFSRASHPVMGSMHSAIPKQIINTLGDKLDRIRTVGKIKLEKSFECEYRNILFDKEISVLCTDDQCLAEALKLHKEDLFIINTITIIDYLCKVSEIDVEEKAILIERFCALGIYNPVLTASQVASSILFRQFSLVEGEDILDTGFIHVFNAIFHGRQEYLISLDQLRSIVASSINMFSSHLDMKILRDIINVWFVRYPKVSKIRALSMLFVLCCADLQYIEESEVNLRGTRHRVLWDLYIEIAHHSDREKSRNDFLIEICNVIAGFKTDESTVLFDSVKKSFSEGDQDYTKFNELYIHCSINKKINNEDKLLKIT